MMKGSIMRITIIYIYTPINSAPKYMKQKTTEMKREIDNSATVNGDFNTPFSIWMICQEYQEDHQQKKGKFEQRCKPTRSNEHL